MTRDRGYDDFLDAVEAGEPYYLEGPDGAWLPPRTVDPATGVDEFAREPLPEPGELLTSTVTHVGPPAFAEDVPYTVGIAAFGPVRVTAQVRDGLEIGDAVSLGVTETETSGQRVPIFRAP